MLHSTGRMLVLVGMGIGIGAFSAAIKEMQGRLSNEISPESVVVGDARSVCSPSGTPEPKDVKLPGAKCKTPEPDCVSKNCFQTSPPSDNMCEDWSDYWWAEDNMCEQSKNCADKCYLYDCVACYDYEQCKKNPLFACTASSDCADKHGPCVTFTYYGFDDCANDY
jgi:hypothetical protein